MVKRGHCKIIMSTKPYFHGHYNWLRFCFNDAKFFQKALEIAKYFRYLHRHRSQNEGLGWPHYRKCGIFYLY